MKYSFKKRLLCIFMNKKSQVGTVGETKKIPEWLIYLILAIILLLMTIAALLPTIKKLR